MEAVPLEPQNPGPALVPGKSVSGEGQGIGSSHTLPCSQRQSVLRNASPAPPRASPLQEGLAVSHRGASVHPSPVPEMRSVAWRAPVHPAKPHQESSLPQAFPKTLGPRQPIPFLCGDACGLPHLVPSAGLQLPLRPPHLPNGQRLALESGRA